MRISEKSYLHLKHLPDAVRRARTWCHRIDPVALYGPWWFDCLIKLMLCVKFNFQLFCCPQQRAIRGKISILDRMFAHVWVSVATQESERVKKFKKRERLKEISTYPLNIIRLIQDPNARKWSCKKNSQSPAKGKTRRKKKKLSKIKI